MLTATIFKLIWSVYIHLSSRATAAMPRLSIEYFWGLIPGTLSLACPFIVATDLLSSSSATASATTLCSLAYTDLLRMGLTWFQIREEKRRVREEKLRQKEEKRLARKQKQLMRQQLKLKKPLVIESCKFWFW